MICFSYINVSTLRKGGSGDIDYDENNINILWTGEHYFLLLYISYGFIFYFVLQLHIKDIQY
jgi:hypothetical protein